MIHHHLVVPGDTLTGIARRYESSIEAIRLANRQIADINLIRVGDVLHVPAADPTPTNTIDRLVDRIATDAARLRSEWSDDVTDERRQIIDQGTADMIADVTRVCDVLAGHGIDPATIVLDGFDDTAEMVDVFGAQNLAPGSVHRNVRFHDVVEHQGDENDQPVIYINCEHVGNQPDLFKLYGTVAPTIMVNCRIRPTAPAPGVNAIRAHHASLFAVDVSHTVDAFWPMDNRPGARRLGWYAYLCRAGDLAWFADDYHPDGSHCDASQYIGGRGVRWYRCDLRANIAVGDPHVDGFGNASIQLSSPKRDDPAGDWFDLGCTFGGGASGWNLGSGRPLDAPVLSLGGVWHPTRLDADVIIPSNLRDGRVHLVGARKADGSPIRVRNWG